jgi:hypothetical protein
MAFYERLAGGRCLEMRLTRGWSLERGCLRDGVLREAAIGWYEDGWSGAVLMKTG